MNIYYCKHCENTLGCTYKNKPLLLYNEMICLMKNASLNVSKYADHTNIDRSTLFRSMVIDYRIQPKVFIENIKIEIALDLMLHIDRKIYDIALSSGFQSDVNFYRAIRRRFENTPSGIRNNILSSLNPALKCEEFKMMIWKPY